MLRNLLFGASGLAMAASVAPSTAQADPSVYFPGATAPTGAVWVEDGLQPAGGHLWVSDHLFGFCRSNPSAAANNGAVLQTATGCLVADGQPAYDPVRKFVYVPDGSSKSVGILRRKLSAQGFFTSGSNINKNLPPAFPDSACKNNNLAGCRPVAVALIDTAGGGDLYIATKRSGGNIYRIRTAGATPSALQLIGSTSDGGPAASLTVIGNDLYIAEAAAISVIHDPSNKVAATIDGQALCNNNNQCVAEPVFLQAQLILPSGVGTDGTNLFIGDFIGTITAFNPATFGETTVATGYVGVSGFGFAPQGTAPNGAARPARVFWGTDPTAGANVLQGNWYSVLQNQLILP